MTPTTNAPADPLELEIDRLEGHLVRGDGKASALVGGTGALAALVVGAAVEHRPPTAAATVGGGGLLALAFALGWAFRVVHPNTKPMDTASWPYWATCTPAEVARQFADGVDQRPARIVNLSRIAARKYGRLRTAFTAAGTGLVLLAVSAALALAEL